jgi:nucleotide-binding universal stress UspA family protein
MKGIDKILFPTDFTEDAQQAFTYALEICKKTGAELHLFHAIEEPYDFAVRIEEQIQHRKDNAYAKLQTMMEDARESERYSNLAIYSEIKRGKPYPSILNKGHDIGADLIIVGTTGESSLKRILYGNVTSSIILESDIPVFTVPANSKKPYLDRFIFATDFRDQDVQALKKTVQFATPFEAEVHVVHISEEKGIESEIKFRGFCDLVNEEIDYPDLHFKNIRAERFSKGISEFMNDFPASLITITRYKKAFLKTILWASSTQELSYHTTVPMLVQIPEAQN